MLDSRSWNRWQVIQRLFFVLSWKMLRADDNQSFDFWRQWSAQWMSCCYWDLPFLKAWRGFLLHETWTTGDAKRCKNDVLTKVFFTRWYVVVSKIKFLKGATWTSSWLFIVIVFTRRLSIDSRIRRLFAFGVNPTGILLWVRKEI